MWPHFPSSKRVTPSPASLPGMTAACPQVPHLSSDNRQCPAPSPTATGVEGRGCRRPQEEAPAVGSPPPTFAHLPSGPLVRQEQSYLPF